MKKTILIFLILCLFIPFCSLNAQWAITYGGSNDDNATSIKQTKDGGYIVAGLTKSFGDGKENVWVLKLSSSGDVEWEYCYFPSVYLYHLDPRSCIRSVSTILQTKDEGYIIAGDASLMGTEAWILKLSSNGQLEWDVLFYELVGGIEFLHAEVSSIQQTKDWGYVIVGTCWKIEYPEIIEPGSPYVMKLSSNGMMKWFYRYEIKKNWGYDFGCYLYDYGRSVSETKDEGYIVAGSSHPFGEGEDDFLVMKLNSTGDVEWQKTYGGSGVDYALSIQQTKDEGYIVVGATYSFGAGDKDVWVLKLDSEGDVEWQSAYGGRKAESARSIQQTKDGGYIVTGWTKSFGAGEDDYLIFKLSSNGSIEWQRTYGGESSDGSSSIQQTEDKGYIVAGDTDSFGTGGFDFLILKLNSFGDIHKSCELLGSSNLTVTDTDITPQISELKHDEQIKLRYWGSLDFIRNETIAEKEVLCEAPPECTLTISATTGGTTDPIPGIYTYDEGSEVTITAIPDAHYRFTGWSGDVSSTDNPVTITMNSDKSITANFIRIIYPPSNFTCQKVLNRSLSQAEYINGFSWKTNPNNVDIVKYRIYLIEGESKSLLVELNANTFQYWHRRVEKDKQYSYAICAVNVEDKEGDPAFITVQ